MNINTDLKKALINLNKLRKKVVTARGKPIPAHIANPDTPLKPRGWTLDVTQDVIDRAKPNNQSWCMLGLTVREQIPGSYSIRIDASMIRFNIGNVKFAYPTPGPASAYVKQFDHDASKEKEVTVKPFKVPLHVRDCYIAPVKRKGPQSPKATKRAKFVPNKPGVKRCIRRYNGLPVVE